MDSFDIHSRSDETIQAHKVRFLLLNPNTTVATTEMMLRIARGIADPDVEIEGMTAPFGPAFITNEQELAVAADAVVAALTNLPGNVPDGIIIAAFGDPALGTARVGTCEIVGIAEASMAEAAIGGRKFSVATTTPDLAAAIRSCAEKYGHGDQLLSVRITQGEPGRTMADPTELVRALEAASRLAIDEDGAEAIIIGGGPLADAARGLSDRIGVPVIEPIPAALRLLESRRKAAS